MSEQPKYIMMILHEQRDGSTVAVRESGTVYRELSAEELIALLNTPPQPAGIVWRKPGEAGRVDCEPYLAAYCGVVRMLHWHADGKHDGWDVENVTAWAELPSPPAWATGGAA